MTTPAEFHRGDCVAIMATFAEHSVDAVVTDPPYGLEFMGKEWDRLDAGLRMQRWHLRWATEALRALKPGGHLLAFGGTRTSHRLVCALEDAGFEIRDTLAWLHGSGLPKSLDVSKAIDKAAEVERERVGAGPYVSRRPRPTADTNIQGAEYGFGAGHVITAPATDTAKQWAGWGTALKPAHEPICLARKPLSEKNVASNVLRWGTGALNVDGCRIQAQGESLARPVNHTGLHEGWDRPWRHDEEALKRERLKRDESEKKAETLGRWPANLLLGCACEGDHDPDCAVRMLDEQSGERAAGHYPARRGAAGLWSGDGGGFNGNEGSDTYTERGGASRFFFTAKASRTDRDTRTGYHAPTGRLNNHPTVKPVDLMRWLVRLVTPLGGVVLDPFLGSGTTAVAAVLEDVRCIGIDQDEESLATARIRIEETAPLFMRGGG